MGHLRVVPEQPSGGVVERSDLEAFHEELIRRYCELCECLNLMPSTAQASVRALRFALRKLERRYVWEITADDVRRFNSILVARGVAASTRAQYCAGLRSICAFLIEEHLQDIARRTGHIMQQPVTRRNAPRSRFCASYARRAPPTRQMVRKVSRSLRADLPRLEGFAHHARDLVVFEMLYLTACRSNEVAMMDVADVHPRKGRDGELHVRFGKGANGSGHRPRWIPILDGMGALLDWYLSVVRPALKPARNEQALLVGDTGKRLSYEQLSAALRRCLKRARVREKSLFTPHRLRHARASHLFADGMNLVAIQKLLGHEFLATTQRYIHVEPTFVAKAHREMVGRTLALLEP